MLRAKTTGGESCADTWNRQ